LFSRTRAAISSAVSRARTGVGLNVARLALLSLEQADRGRAWGGDGPAQQRRLIQGIGIGEDETNAERAQDVGIDRERPQVIALHLTPAGASRRIAKACACTVVHSPYSSKVGNV
jgi:hypothetical protein